MAANVVFSHVGSGVALVRFNANAQINVAANSTVNSDIASAASGNDAIVGASITQLYWSLPSGNVTIARGSNTILVLSGTDHWNLRDGGLVLSEFPAAPVNVTFSAAGGTLLVELRKQY